MHAGRTIFKVVTGKGDHVLQVARLRNGYTLAQAGFRPRRRRSTATPRRSDASTATSCSAVAPRPVPNKPGWISVSLPAGQFVFIDQNSNAFTMVTVFGKAPVRQQVRDARR